MRALRHAALCITVSLLTSSATLGVSRWLRRAPPPPATGVVRPTHAAAMPTTDACQRRRAALLADTPLPGTATLGSVRAELVARAKAEPVLFLEPPRSPELPPDLAMWRRRLHRTGVPWQVLNEVFSRYLRYPGKLRQLLLTDGYLYAEKPDLAALLAGGLGLSQLFSEPEVSVTRGHRTWRAVRRNNDYVWTDGPEAGKPARIWLFDRMALPGEVLGPSRHISLGTLRDRLGATRIEVEHMTSRAVVASLVYGERQVPAVLSIANGQLELECEAVPPGARPEVEAARTREMRQGRVLDRLLAAIAEQVGEALPFDEPRTEDGQQDGRLRQEWRTAYLQGSSRFEFNGDWYPVFRLDGVPRVPQVCVDFITDTWERMAGTRWGKRDETRQRRVGRLDFDALNIENRRSVDSFISFAVAHPHWFDVMTIPESERVPFANRGAFFRQLFQRRGDFRPGDVVAILGPRDDGLLHYHSFFIVASDPFTSMPTLVAANAGQPRIRTWEGEMQNAPRRGIVARVRPRLEWLEAIAGIDASSASE